MNPAANRLRARSSAGGHLRPGCAADRTGAAPHPADPLADLPLAPFVLVGVTVLGLGSVASWSRLATGSIWPSVLLHATGNPVIQSGFGHG
jgi:membrane protease YdiL (CAAX protease family)